MKAKLTKEQMEYIVDRGMEFVPATLPRDLERHPIGTCFDACAIQAIKNRKYRYVEGIAKPLNGDWTLHAWLTDGVQAFDPTWQTIDNLTGKEVPFAGVYIGIEMDTIEVAKFMKATGYQGIIANRWRNEELAKNALESIYEKA